MFKPNGGKINILGFQATVLFLQYDQSEIIPKLIRHTVEI